MGKKGGSSTTVQSYKPTEEEKRLWRLQGDYEESVMPNAVDLNTKAKKLLENSIGETQVDYKNLLGQATNINNSAMNGYQNLANGQLPTSYTDNINKVVTNSVNQSMGNLLNNLSQNGVINSSVASQGIQGINQAAANTAADMYRQDISQLADIYGNISNMAGANISLGAAAQEAAQQPAVNLWNTSIGLSGTNLGAISAMGGKGTSTSTQRTSGGSGIWGGILGGLASNGGLFCFTGDTLIKTPNGDKPLKRIRKGDIITTPNGDEKVTDVMTPHYARVYAICTDESENKCINLTATQPMLMEDGNWKTLEEMRIGERFKDRGKIVLLVESGDRLVYDIKVPSGMYYANGFIAKAGTTEW
jgi:hypothetical protein